MSDGQQRWTVRGVPANLTSAVSAAAMACGVTVGEALRAHLSGIGKRAVPDRGEAMPGQDGGRGEQWQTGLRFATWIL
jgi:hypothetical protein